MKKLWKVTKNYGDGLAIYAKSPELCARIRTTFLSTKQQKAMIDGYCQKTGMTLTDLIRTALSEYFDRVGFDLPENSQDDQNQLKMF